MKAIRAPIQALSLLAVMAILSGCGGSGHEDIKKWMEESSRDLRGRVPPLPELKPFPIISYEAHNQMDPFAPGRVEPEKKEGGGAKPDFDRPREQLENFPLESLRFVGLMNKDKGKEKHALIQVEGVVYQVGKGNYLGQSYGRIVDITDSEIILKEIVQDPSGQTTDWVERQVTLQLQEGSQDEKGAKK